MNEEPGVVGWQALATLGAFVFVMLVVPWLLTRDMARAPREHHRRDGLFSSRRERSLWVWTAAVMVAIYLTLSPAQVVAADLRARGLLGATTWFVFLCVGAVALARWAKTHPGTAEMGAVLGVAAVYVTTLIRLPVPEARSHLFEYGLVGMLVYQALLERARSGRRVPVPALLAVVVTSALGWIDEGIQALLPNRVYDLRDAGFNALAACLAVGATAFVRWVRRRFDQRARPTGYTG